jgi:hypothetical protein
VSAESPSTGQPPPTHGFPPGEPPEPGAERISRDVAIAQSEDAVTRFSPAGPVRIKSAEELPYAEVARRFGPQGLGSDARVAPDREVWLVLIDGEFTVPAPAGDEPMTGTAAYTVVDSYSGVLFERGVDTADTPPVD